MLAESGISTLFPHPHFDDTINRRVIQSEIEGGVHLDELARGTVLEVQTQGRWYTIQIEEGGAAWISGHPIFCPEPVLVQILGSTWGGSMLWERFLGRGMHMEFRHPDFLPITTSAIVDLRIKD
ncbi:MAG TPA: hypothetical protein VJ732_02220 [Bryobacteraceae bacterium]|nr:hypothetical protein [Bryobacteraceae bacterium]